MKVVLFLGIALIGVAMPLHWAFSHSGGLDSNGCHAGSQPYHCHGSGRVRRAAPTTGKLRVIALPRARVYIDDKFIGLSPTRAVRKSIGSVEVRLEHVALGSHEFTTTVTGGETSEVSVRW